MLPLKIQGTSPMARLRPAIRCRLLELFARRVCDSDLPRTTVTHETARNSRMTVSKPQQTQSLHMPLMSNRSFRASQEVYNRGVTARSARTGRALCTTCSGKGFRSGHEPNPPDKPGLASPKILHATSHAAGTVHCQPTRCG